MGARSSVFGLRLGMRISQLAEQAEVPVSTVRYYERIGLLGSPSRSAAGYRDYDDEASTQLLFIARSRRLGLTCDQVAELLPVWAGVDCVSAHARVSQLIDDKRLETAARIAELAAFAAQLDEAKGTLEASPPPQVCCDDLTCCVPSNVVESVPVDIGGRHELPVI
jgi:DNA-binding transcriptional MerR regulator